MTITTESNWNKCDMALEALSHEELTSQQSRSLRGQLRVHNAEPALKMLQSRGWSIEMTESGESWAPEFVMIKELDHGGE